LGFEALSNMVRDLNLTDVETCYKVVGTILIRFYGWTPK
jgi:hypothetical protein